MGNIVMIVKNNPVAVAMSGSASGFLAWLIAHAEAVTIMFQLVGGFFGCLLAVVSFLFVLPRLVRFVKRAYRRGFEQADREK